MEEVRWRYPTILAKKKLVSRNSITAEQNLILKSSNLAQMTAIVSSAALEQNVTLFIHFRSHNYSAKKKKNLSDS